MSEDEATINDCSDHNDVDIVLIPRCSTAFIDTISFSKQITTYQETYATVDKLMLLDHYNGFCRVEGWCCTNQLICNTDFYYKKKQNQFRIHFKPNQHAKF